VGSGCFWLVAAPAVLLQRYRALAWLGPEQNHLAGRGQQHVDLALLEIGVDKQVEARWMYTKPLNPSIAQHEIRHGVPSRYRRPMSPHYTGRHQDCPGGDQAC